MVSDARSVDRVIARNASRVPTISALSTASPREIHHGGTEGTEDLGNALCESVDALAEHIP